MACHRLLTTTANRKAIDWIPIETRAQLPVFGAQRDGLWLWVETCERRQARDLNAATAAKVDQYVAAVEAFAASNTVILALANELAAGTIEATLAKSDLELGVETLAEALARQANPFPDAFAAGITVATFDERQRTSFEHFGELIAELFKLAALLVFGALITPALLGSVGWTGWLFAILALVLARPAAIWLSFLGSGLSVREQAAVAWFGPKGFASVVYALIVLSSGIAAAQQVFQLVAVTIVASILLHSSTDIVVARGFDDERDVPAWFGKAHRLRGRLPEDGPS
ncbi:cation:proton antiporter [Nonomuraea zeae]|uniref:cation:proton antiporter domain-containing protein n=1 Tax=Nonomuraea zeae TaxID=1642303 RepID=UPI001F0E317D|nr:cation:proton antiporter [Nonomuraea zeae]